MSTITKTQSKSCEGTLICLVGVLILTPDALLIRAAGDLHPPTLLFFRYGFHACSILCFLISRYGKETLSKLKDIGWIGVLCGVIFGTSNIFFTTAVQYTAAANVLVILAVNPLFSALFSWILVGDVIKVRTAVTILVGLGAISLIFYDEISGGSSTRSILGNVFACCTCVLMGLFFAVVKYANTTQRKGINMVPCNVVAGSFVALVSLAMGAQPTSDEVWDMASPSNLWYLLLQGTVVLPLSFGLLTLAPRYLSAPEVSLFLLIETCLGPLWVYLGGYESPPPNTLLGGCVLVVALAIHSYLAIKEEKNTRRRRGLASKKRKKKMKVRDTKECAIYDLNYVEVQDGNDVHKIIDVTAVSENEVNISCSGEITFQQL